MIVSLGDSLYILLRHVVSKSKQSYRYLFQRIAFVFLYSEASYFKRELASVALFSVDVAPEKYVYNNTSLSGINCTHGFHPYHRRAIYTSLMKEIDRDTVSPEIFRNCVASLKFHSTVICFRKEYLIIFLGT